MTVPVAGIVRDGEVLELMYRFLVELQTDPPLNVAPPVASKTSSYPLVVDNVTVSDSPAVYVAGDESTVPPRFTTTVNVPAVTVAPITEIPLVS